MTAEEFSDQFDVLYNNITSNQAPGLTEYEKSVFLTKAQNEIVKNYFTANSKGNNIGQGFDDSAKRQADFSCLMMTYTCSPSSGVTNYTPIDYRSDVYTFPTDVFIVINETVQLSTPKNRVLQVVPLRYDEYLRLMSKPFKRPLKYQAWRLINQGKSDGTINNRYAELILGPNHVLSAYHIRYIRFPKPIIIGDLDGLTIDGYEFGDSGSGGGDDPTPPTPTPTVITISPSLETALTDIQGQSSAPSDGFGFRVPATLIGGMLSYSGSASTQFTYAEVVRNIDDEEELNLIQTGSLADITSDISHSREHDILVWIASASVDGQTLTYTSTPTSSVITSPSSSSVSSSTKKTSGCELDPILHQDILQRAIELAKIAWTATGQDNAQMVLQAGQRSE